MLGTQTGADGKEIVANLFLPIVHQIMDNSNYLLDEELEDGNAGAHHTQMRYHTIGNH